MNIRLAWGPMVCGGLSALLAALACTADKVTSPPREAGIPDNGRSPGIGGKDGSGGSGAAGAGPSVTDGGHDGDRGDAGGRPGVSLCGGKHGDAQITCGEYIVRHIDACGSCHTPVDPATGRPSLSPALFLTGNPSFADLDPTDAEVGNVPAPNLTLLVKDGWTAADLRSAILDGVRPASPGGGLVPIMPYATLHNMAREDADAIVAYIMSLPPKGHEMPGRDPLPASMDAFTLPIPPFKASLIPDPASAGLHHDDAMYGKYLAAQLGLCMECHTPRDSTMQLDASKLFAGGESFHLPLPFGTVTSMNITPAKNGIRTWDAENVKNLILTGLDDEGVAICPPMPVGPDGAFGGMNANDALAIGYYVTSLPGIVNPPDGSPFKMCVPPAPPPPPKDGGVQPSMPDAAVTRGDGSSG